jgi:flagellar biosynthesis/type III secretory pathway M-ring protein FliF/YscJ
MLIVALVLAVIGLAALVTAVVTSNELIAWVCIAASVVGVLLLIVDAVRERSRRDADEAPAAGESEGPAEFDEEYPEEPAVADEPDFESDVETTAVINEKVDDFSTGTDDTADTADEDRR